MFDQVCSRDEEYKRKVERSVEPLVVAFLSTLDDKCKAVTSDIGELSDEFRTIKFYQVDVRKRAMLSRALSNTELPVVVFTDDCKNGARVLCSFRASSGAVDHK
jgi:thioredoxin 1